jgi:hypothetical protein
MHPHTCLCFSFAIDIGSVFESYILLNATLEFFIRVSMSLAFVCIILNKVYNILLGKFSACC